MKVTYSDDKSKAYFDGKKFRLDAKTGYYLGTKPTYNGRRERLHCYVWRYYNGPVKEGCHIHHKDENKGNNDIENLACVNGKTHSKYHITKYVINHQEQMRENIIANVIPKAAEWHRSEEGRKWHSEHAKQMDFESRKVELVCEYCGGTYKSISNGKNRFCSNNCKAAARRESGVDDVERECVICGGKFMANKYSDKRTCSKGCCNKLSQDKRNQKIRERACV